MQTMEFMKIYTKHILYAAINQVADLSENKREILEVFLLCCDWQISIYFARFCFQISLMAMIDGSIKYNLKFGFEL